MTARVVVVGSGASGVHFALSLLRKGLHVTMLDVGRQGAGHVVPDARLNTLKETLSDPAGYFLGSRYEGVFLPGTTGEYYGIPPSKNYVLDHVSGFGYSSAGFAPLFSFARGGLGEVWTGGCYPLNETEAAEFPFSYGELAQSYSEVARRIGITGEQDDLARFMPLHDHLQPPLRLDPHSQMLMERYQKVRGNVNGLGAYVGRTRVATLSQPLGSRLPCDYLGRCLWGCPRGALYTPSQTLQECQTYPTFDYVPGVVVDHFTIGPGERVRAVVARSIDGGAEHEFVVDRLALAAGALLSTQIVLRSIFRHAGERVRLRGLMDNRQILVPFVNLTMVGKPFVADSYQYHLLGMGIESSTPLDYVHCQITTLKTGMVHPIVQRLPFDLATSTLVMRWMHAALGVVNVNFRDTSRPENYVELSDDDRSPQLRIHYEPDRGERARLGSAIDTVKRTLRALRCVVPPGMTQIRPMGASVHYAGTLPMTTTSAPFTTTPHCQSRDFDNLFLVDGATFPVLPSKNITFTLMANAVRVANAAF